MKNKERCLVQPQAQEAFSTYVFEPSLLSLVPPRIQGHFSISDRAKLLLRLLRGYLVYYQVDEHQQLVSYCFLKHNYLNKYAFLPPPGE